MLDVRPSLRLATLAFCLAAATARAGLDPALVPPPDPLLLSPDERVVQACLGVHVHGVTEADAHRLVGEEGVPLLRELLRDPAFPRRDNVVAFLGWLSEGEATLPLLDFLTSPPASPSDPNEDRARLLVPVALGQAASRGDRVALEALLEMTGEDALEGLLAQAADAAAGVPRQASDLRDMALQGLAWSGQDEALARLAQLSAGHVRAARGLPDASAAARQALALRAFLDGDPRPLSVREAEQGPGLPGEDVEAMALDGSSRVHASGITYANHPNTLAPMSDVQLDAILAGASTRMGRAAFAEDVACCVLPQRSGSALSFGTAGDGLDSIDSQVELDLVLDNPVARVKVVRLINFCGVPGTNIIGCANSPGFGVAVVRLAQPAMEQLVWVHETGHNLGLGHNPDARYIMAATLDGTQDALTAAECAAWHAPPPAAQLAVSDRGACVDADGDQVHDAVDNCLLVANNDQADPDADGWGTACDNCPTTANADQADLDFDGQGNVCDPDRDGDSIANGTDNCPDLANGSQANQDGDALGDACDPDRDGDGIANGIDNCPDDSNPSQSDGDGDGRADACDNCPLASNAPQTDGDSDGVGDACDNCAAASNAGQQNGDFDARGDACDNCPTVTNANQSDGDGDGDGDLCDNCPSISNSTQVDFDTDGRGNPCDNCFLVANPGQQDGDGDGDGDACDNCPATTNGGQEDADADGVGDVCDNCPANANPTQADTDLDGRADACDNCARYSNPTQADADGDGLGDTCEFKWGDLAPAAAPDGLVTVADVVRALRFSVALDVPSAAELRRGDVAPATQDASNPPVATPTQPLPQLVDVTDVVLLLRASVNLVVFAQPR